MPRDFISTLTQSAMAKVSEIRERYEITSPYFTRKDFYRICTGENIHVFEIDLRQPGYYVHHEGDAYIFLQKPFNLFVAFHEIGHHLYRHLQDSRPKAIREREADLFAELTTGEVRDESR